MLENDADKMQQVNELRNKLSLKEEIALQLQQELLTLHQFNERLQDKLELALQKD